MSSVVRFRRSYSGPAFPPLMAASDSLMLPENMRVAHLRPVPLEMGCHEPDEEPEQLGVLSRLRRWVRR